MLVTIFLSNEGYTEQLTMKCVLLDVQTPTLPYHPGGGMT